MDIDFDAIFTDTVGDMAAFIPKLVGFVLVFVVGYFVAKWIRRAIIAVLKKVNFDSYLDRAGIGAPLERAGFADSGRFLAQLIYYLIMLMVLKLSLSAFGNNDISAALDGLIAWIPKLLVAIVVIIITGLVANAAARDHFWPNVYSRFSSGESADSVQSADNVDTA